MEKRVFSLNVEFAISMDVTKQMIVLRRNFIFLCLYQKEQELATIDERILEVRRSVIMKTFHSLRSILMHRQRSFHAQR